MKRIPRIHFHGKKPNQEKILAPHSATNGKFTMRRHFALFSLRFVACRTTDNYVNTHVAVDDYYRNKTLCVITESDGTNRKINFTAPVNFEISGS